LTSHSSWTNEEREEHSEAKNAREHDVTPTQQPAKTELERSATRTNRRPANKNLFFTINSPISSLKIATALKTITIKYTKEVLFKKVLVRNHHKTLTEMAK
jgi:hypothetical protein